MTEVEEPMLVELRRSLELVAPAELPVLQPQLLLREDLGLSSLAILRLLMECERRLGIELAGAPDELLNLTTVMDLLVLVRALRAPR